MCTSYIQVGRFLFANGLEHCDAVVFLDHSSRKMALLRSNPETPIALDNCGVSHNRRFTFYDQVHTTGVDIAQMMTAKAVVTLGKDMTWRDYGQGCYRMRGLER